MIYVFSEDGGIKVRSMKLRRCVGLREAGPACGAGWVGGSRGAVPSLGRDMRYMGLADGGENPPRLLANEPDRRES